MEHDGHFHNGIEAAIFSGLSAIVVINLIRFGAAKIATRDDIIGSIGRAAGALVTS